MKFPLLIGLHCHQPVHNFSHVVDEATERSYAPFLKLAEKHEKFRFVVHYSGWLLEYICEHHKDTFKLLKKLSDRGQVEFFGGGYYEPILSAIPSDDRRGQINKLSKLIREKFGQTVTGLWLTERVWDPAILPDIVACGIEDVIVDDYHFLSAGFHESTLGGYFRTEQDGAAVNIFPIDQGLRYKIPFTPAEDVVKYVTDARDSGKKMLVCFDDGEKFGLWPDTYDWVYGDPESKDEKKRQGWLEQFMIAAGEGDNITMSHFADIKAAQKPEGMAYLPITSYHEMGEWSLFTDAQLKFKELEKFLQNTQYANYSRSFVRGSVWKNFFVKYPESNKIHKRTVDLSKRKCKDDQSYLDFLYQSQCNDCLWHGVFGGLYLPNLRNNAWNAIIEAEKTYEKLENIKFPSAEVRDSNLDGYDEVYLRTENFNAEFVSRDGGQMSTLEWKKPVFNLMNTLSRRPEGYHELFSAEKQTQNTEPTDGVATIHDKQAHAPEEMKKHLGYDWYNRNSFIDHFAYSFEPHQFIAGTFNELGDFVNRPMNIESTKSGCRFTRNGGLFYNDRVVDSVLTKEYEFDKNSISCRMKFRGDAVGNYVQEHNVHVASVSDVTFNGQPLRQEGDVTSLTFRTKELVMADPYTGANLTWKWDQEMSIFIYVVNTVSLAVDTMELTAQGVCVLASCGWKDKIDMTTILTIV